MKIYIFVEIPRCKNLKNLRRNHRVDYKLFYKIIQTIYKKNTALYVYTLSYCQSRYKINFSPKGCQRNGMVLNKF